MTDEAVKSLGIDIGQTFMIVGAFGLACLIVIGIAELVKHIQRRRH